jgi:hypothetical protein
MNTSTAQGVCTVVKEASTIYRSGHKVPVTGTHIVTSTKPNAPLKHEDDKHLTKALKESKRPQLTMVEPLPGVFRTNTGILVVMPK